MRTDLHFLLDPWLVWATCHLLSAEMDGICPHSQPIANALHQFLFKMVDQAHFIVVLHSDLVGAQALIHCSA